MAKLRFFFLSYLLIDRKMVLTSVGIKSGVGVSTGFSNAEKSGIGYRTSGWI